MFRNTGKVEPHCIIKHDTCTNDVRINKSTEKTTDNIFQEVIEKRVTSSDIFNWRNSISKVNESTELIIPTKRNMDQKNLNDKEKK